MVLNKLKNDIEFLLLKFGFITTCLNKINAITTTTNDNKKIEQSIFKFLI